MFCIECSRIFFKRTYVGKFIFKSWNPENANISLKKNIAQACSRFVSATSKIEHKPLLNLYGDIIDNRNISIYVLRYIFIDFPLRSYYSFPFTRERNLIAYTTLNKMMKISIKMLQIFIELYLSYIIKVIKEIKIKMCSHFFMCNGNIDRHSIYQSMIQTKQNDCIFADDLTSASSI